MDVYAEALQRDYGNLFISPYNLFEAWTRVDRCPDHRRRFFLANLENAFPMRLVPTDAEQLHLARGARRQFGRGSGSKAKLNMGDCFAYALSKRIAEPLLYKGKDFPHTDVVSAL